MKIYLRDRNREMADEWSKAFAGQEDVFVSCGDIFGLQEQIDAIVSPANSFGFMDGGIDYFYSERFGWGMSLWLREQLAEQFGGELLVGQATVVETADHQIPYLICAPTMRVPMEVINTVNAYLAFRATLRIAKHFQFKSILCPGLGTAVGQMPKRRCALQMLQAYREQVLGEHRRYESLDEASVAHFKMLDLDIDFRGQFDWEKKFPKSP